MLVFPQVVLDVILYSMNSVHWTSSTHSKETFRLPMIFYGTIVLHPSEVLMSKMRVGPESDHQLK
jgi:hypothetical protein